ncbi:unnamed protein product [Gongylonema pulchrum]|uniref:ABC transporter family G domain-containing protein n=1 Tax=Gongylonema pulchrum TaxID=637853 RepID=A0A3P7RUM3_9BILA|nr:unnamed protein product [Gongylonema pulchrum]
MKVLADLDLKHCVSSRIASSGHGKGITSGEAKRLAFATEILTNPSLLFADEPTTGIDSYMAYHVVKVLENLSSISGKTIICTIHQPASDIFEMFDRVLFLANGRVAFLGSSNFTGKTIICTIHQPASDIFEMFDRVLFLANGRVAFLGAPAEAIKFFGAVGYPIPRHTNPADFFIQTLSIVPGNEEKCTERATKIADAVRYKKCFL